MPVLHIDFETCSALHLPDVGVSRYSRDASTDVHCAAYAVDDGLILIWKHGEPLPAAILDAAGNPAWTIHAFNAGFERNIWQHILTPRYGWPAINPDQWRCTQATALALALPPSLGAVAAALELEARKDKVGQRLMLKLADSSYCPSAIELDQLYEYCRQDVEVERGVHSHIGELPETEQALWVLDQAINARGVPIDVKGLDQAIATGTRRRNEIDAELSDLTGGAVTSAGQAERFLCWLAAHGIKIAKVRKATLQQVLKRDDLTDKIRRTIELRIEGAPSTVSRLETMRAHTDRDSRLRFAFKHHGAATGRWSSFGVQLQNQPNDGPGREVIAAAPGHHFIVGDLSGIESRTIAELADEKSKLDLWRRFDTTGKLEDDPYYILGLRCGVTPDKARAIGKTADLAFGFMGGVGAWRRLAPNDASTDEQVKTYRDTWRAAHPRIVEFWRELNRTAILAVHRPGIRHDVNDKIFFRFDGIFLKMRLPSGREIAYPFPRLEKNEHDSYVVSFKDNAHGRFKDCRNGHGAWPGLWCENAVQGTARDLLADNMLRLEAAGYLLIRRTLKHAANSSTDHGGGKRRDVIAYAATVGLLLPSQV